MVKFWYLTYFAHMVDDCAREIDWGIMDLSQRTDCVFKTRCRIHPSFGKYAS